MCAAAVKVGLALAGDVRESAMQRSASVQSCAFEYICSTGVPRI